MAGTRTAPDITVATTVKNVSIRLVDASGDNYSVNLKVPVAMTQVALEALVANYQLSTQASIYQVDVSESWAGDEDPDNAETNQRNSVKQGVNMLFKDASNQLSTSTRVVAPIPAILQGNQDIPLLVAPLTDLATSLLVAHAPKTLASIQYTERRERANNPRVKV